MKVTVYSCREFDEKELFIQYGKELGLELVLCPDAPSFQNVALAKGSDCMDILTTPMTEELLGAFREAGVRYLVSAPWQSHPQWRCAASALRRGGGARASGIPPSAPPGGRCPPGPGCPPWPRPGSPGRRPRPPPPRMWL